MSSFDEVLAQLCEYQGLQFVSRITLDHDGTSLRTTCDILRYEILHLVLDPAEYNVQMYYDRCREICRQFMSGTPGACSDCLKNAKNGEFRMLGFFVEFFDDGKHIVITEDGKQIYRQLEVHIFPSLKIEQAYLRKSERKAMMSFVRWAEIEPDKQIVLPALSK